jgi:hypothetical protein
MRGLSPIWIAALGAGVTIAFQVLGKALRDTLFLTAFSAHALPWMVGASAVAAIGSSFLMSRLIAEVGPKRATVTLYLASAALLVVEHVWVQGWPAAAAIAVFAHISVIAALLVSGFWSTVIECFDPSSAKKNMSRIAAGATAGGLLGGLLAERLAAWSSPGTGLLVLSGGHVLAALVCSGLRPQHAAVKSGGAKILPPKTPAITRDRYLLSLALVIVLATAAANILDFIFKAEASSRLEPAALMACFGFFYTGVGVLTFLVQITVGPHLLKNLGVARSTLPLPGVVLLGIGGIIAVPGLASAIIARGIEAVVRNSFFRTGYELFFLPLNAEVRRRTKTLIDVGADRLGDIVGALSIITTLFFVSQAESRLPLSVLAVLFALGVALVLESLRRGYVCALASSLAQQAGHEDSNHGDSLLLQTMAGFSEQGIALSSMVQARPEAQQPSAQHPSRSAPLPDPQDLAAQLSGQSFDVTLLSSLKERAAKNPQPLIAILQNSQASFAARRRIPRVLVESKASGVQAALFFGLNDRRFEVRFHCGSALFLRHERQQSSIMDSELIYDAIEREVRVDKRLWQTRELLEAADDSDGQLVDDILSARADRSLQHVFHLLSLLHPAAPLRIAFRGLHSDTPMLRGTALEYLESILPRKICVKLWPLLGESERDQGDRPADQVLESLLHSYASIEQELKRKFKKA